MTRSGTCGLSWPSIARLGLVQVAIGAVVVLMTSTLNRVMVVELGLAAAVPGALVGLHFFVQLLRPRMGFGSDRHGRRIPWIVAGMVVVALSGIGAAAATAIAATDRTLGLAIAVGAFALLGLGVSASSTPFLAYLAERVDADRLPGAAALTWIMMIAGIIVSATVVGGLLDPYSHDRLVAVTAGVGGVAVALVLLALVGRDDGPVRLESSAEPPSGSGREVGFREAAATMWAEPDSRLFATFIFFSMLAYSAQDIILEPFAGVVFGMTPGESTRIAGLQHGGVLIGMLFGAVAASRALDLRQWSAIGCLTSAVALVALIASANLASIPFMKSSVFGLGFANGVFAVAAIGAMMGISTRGSGGAGLRMGFWGASQALAYGMGGFLGAAASDLGRSVLGGPQAGYIVVFAAEACLFVVSAALVVRVRSLSRGAGRQARLSGVGIAMAGSR